MIKIATVCSGIGSPEFAINDLGIEHEIVFGCEIDKYARASYKAIYGNVPMYEDMTKQEWNDPNQYSDLFIGGIPCQSFSLAGKRLGELDPRGLLFFDFYRYVKNQQPKVFIIENVKGLLSDAGGKTFSNWLHLLGNSVNGHIQMFNHADSLGYNLHHTVLNTKNFGLPQNRERVFIVGIRADLPNTFSFPKGWPLKLRLKDILESEVEEKYYLSDKMLNYLNTRKDNFNNGKINYKFENDVASCINASSKSIDISDNLIVEPQLKQVMQLPGKHEATGRVYDANGLCPTITAKQGGGHEPKIIEPVQLGKSKQFAETSQLIGGENQLAFCIRATESNGIRIDKYRIRRLLPIECWRLQGFPDEAFYKAKAVNSDSQLYKQAGNSISTPVIKAIIENLIHLL